MTIFLELWISLTNYEHIATGNIQCTDYPRPNTHAGNITHVRSFFKPDFVIFFDEEPQKFNHGIILKK